MSPRYSMSRGDAMQFEFWLVFGADGSMRFSRGIPSLARGERGMSCTANLPKSLFRTPELKATIGIKEGVPSSFQIDIEAAGEALRHAVGVDIDLRIADAEEPRP